jgi:hypothetical protein
MADHSRGFSSAKPFPFPPLPDTLHQMPSEHEPIEARVVDGVAQASPSGPAPAPRGPVPQIGGSWGCLLFPCMMAIASLVLGLWLISGWEKLSPLAAFGAVVLTLFGVGVIGLIITMVLLLLRLKRLMRNLTQDVKQVMEGMQQVTPMHVRPEVRVDAQAPADPDDALAADPAALPEPPPTFPDPAETPENKPPTGKNCDAGVLSAVACG